MATKGFSLTDVVTTRFEEFLKMSGKTTQAAKEQMQKFMLEIDPRLQKAIEAGDQMSLDALQDAVISRSGSTVLNLIAQERQAVTAIIMTAVHTAIVLAAGV